MSKCLPIEDGDKAVIGEQQSIAVELEGRCFLARRGRLVRDQPVAVYAVRQTHDGKPSGQRDGVDQLTIILERRNRPWVEAELRRRFTELPFADELIHISIE